MVFNFCATGPFMKHDLLAKLLLAAALALCQINTQAASQAPVAAEKGRKLKRAD
jgi:hypothetical protein